MELTVKSLVKSFGEKIAVDNICFSAHSGAAFGLLGRNGAGKTTTMRMIMGLYEPDSGEVLLDGKPVRRDYGTIGYLPEERGLYLKRGILEQLIYFGKLRGLTKEDAKESSMYWLERLGLQEYANKNLDVLSKGNQQKIQLAQALISDPQILVLDEPFSGFDPVNAMMLKNIVKEQIDKGKLVIFSSHQMNYVEEFCDNIAILKSGKVVISGSIKAIKRSYERTRLVINSVEQEKIIKLLVKHPMVKKIGLKNGDGLIVIMQDAKNKQEIVRAVVSSGIDFDKIYIQEPELVDIFVSCTGGNV